MDKTPDRRLDPDDFGTYIECKGDSSDCMKLVLESEQRALRCGPCFQKYMMEQNRKERRFGWSYLSDALIDITRSLK